MFLSMVRNRWFWVSLGIILFGVGVWAWTERHALLTWHYARELVRADEMQRGVWLDKLAELDRAHVVPTLLWQLESGEEQARANSAWALAELARRWSADQTGSLYLARVVQRDFDRLSPSARGEALSVLAEVALGQKSGKGVSATWIEAAGELVLRSSEKPEPGVQAGALRLALVLLRQDRPAQEIVGKAFASACRTLAEAGLQSEAPGTRTAAVRVASLPELGLLNQVAPLALGPKRDPHAEVRSLALTAIAAHEDIASTEDLLPLLHDADPEVRATCEHALRGRGLTGPHVQLARQMSDPQAQVRARVPAQVSLFSELDARLWLDRLSRDPSPAVRAAVLRAAAEVDQEQLLERLEAMAASDPSPTVRQIANYYLRAR